MLREIIDNILVLFLIQPLVEYFGHRSLHMIRSKVHYKHHIVKYEDYLPSRIPYFISLTGFCVLPSWYILWVAICKYQLVHTAIHHTDVLPNLRDHHELHHKYPSYNFGFSAIWPDKLFNTLKK